MNRQVLGACAFMALMGVATPVAAHSADADADRATLRLDVSGTIAPRCVISLADAQLQLALVNATGNVRLPFDVDCNDRMAVQLRSRNGALIHERSATLIPSAGFDSQQPYRLSISIGAGETSPTYESRDLFAAPAVFETSGIPGVTSGQLAVSWSRSQPLLGGDYHDVIEIRVSAAGETDERG
jgi:hypothetical protein